MKKLENKDVSLVHSMIPLVSWRKYKINFKFAKRSSLEPPKACSDLAKQYLVQIWYVSE